MSHIIQPGRIPLAVQIVPTALAETSPFAKLGYKPDAAKAYIECAVCHSLPAGRFTGAGGAANGNELGLWASVIAASHGSLLHQQLNIRHQLKTYADDPKNKHDRIIGCVVATQVVASKSGRMRGPSNVTESMGSSWTDGADCHIAALMVVHKLADGVNRLLGDHITSREEQSVSIEMECKMQQLGVMNPATGEHHSFASLPDAWAETIQWKDAAGVPYAGLPVLGSIDGTRLVMTYGNPGDAIAFNGIATTPNPAENKAKITNVLCEDDGSRLRIAAERVDEVALCGRTVRLPKTGREGRVAAVLTQGSRYGHKATAEAPLLQVLAGRDVVFVRPEWVRFA